MESDINRLNDIGSDIIKAAFEVRNTAGNMFRESFCASALAWELQQMGHEIATEYPVQVIYKNKVIDNSYSADIVVDKSVLIELKALKKMGEAEVRQILSYMKLASFKLGYLINFGAKDFEFGRITDRLPLQKGLYRVVNKI